MCHDFYKGLKSLSVGRERNPKSEIANALLKGVTNGNQ
jgi:hypothetical protein